MEDLKKAKRNWEEKLYYFEYELSIIASPSEKFELQKRIQECEEKIEKLKQIETNLNFFKEEVDINLQKKQPEVIPSTKPKINLQGNNYQSNHTNSNIYFQEFQQEITKLQDQIKKRIANVKAGNGNFDPYSKLHNYLKKKEWEKADWETIQIILDLTKRQKHGFIRNKDIGNFPYIDLLRIDFLWLEASENRFGFSIQRHIWKKNLGIGLKFDKLNNSENLHDFGVFVGWYKDGEFLKSRDNYNFSLDAPQGHLPSLRFPCSEFPEMNWWQSWKRIYINFLIHTDKCLSN